MKRILVAGGGFAGLWSAAGAIRRMDELGLGTADIEVSLLNKDAFHSIRVRNYEADLSEIRVPLDAVLGPIGVRRLEGEMVDVDLAGKTVSYKSESATGLKTASYDRLVFATGSRVVRPGIPGLREFAFTVDTYREAALLDEHLRGLAYGEPAMGSALGQYTVLVVGAGLTGVELATELPQRLRRLARTKGDALPWRVILADRSPRVGSNMGAGACEVIIEALQALGVAMKVNASLESINGEGAMFSGGDFVAAKTVAWCAGMEASPLTKMFPVERDSFGRLPVDRYLRVNGIADVFAAGDVARLMVDDTHVSVMSCQHSRPMGRYAGYNVVSDLAGQALLPLQIDWYVTVLDLGAWGAVYTEGWDRAVVSQGAAAKVTKQTINRQRIYPPLTGSRRDILEAAAPVVQTAPAKQVH